MTDKIRSALATYLSAKYRDGEIVFPWNGHTEQQFLKKLEELRRNG